MQFISCDGGSCNPQGKPTDSPQSTEPLSNEKSKPNENPLCPVQGTKKGSLG